MYYVLYSVYGSQHSVWLRLTFTKGSQSAIFVATCIAWIEIIFADVLKVAFHFLTSKPTLPWQQLPTKPSIEIYIFDTCAYPHGCKMLRSQEFFLLCMLVSLFVVRNYVVEIQFVDTGKGSEKIPDRKTLEKFVAHRLAASRQTSTWRYARVKFWSSN